MEDEIKKMKKEKWLDVWFTIEALGVSEEIVKSSLEEHVEKLCRVKDVFVYEKGFKDVKKVEKPMRNIDTAYSYVASVKFFTRTLSTLLGVVLTYGPSSVEIMGQAKKEIEMGEAQEIANVLAGLVNEFAAAGVGGIVITPPDDKRKQA